jgi:hypothetical protein
MNGTIETWVMNGTIETWVSVINYSMWHSTNTPIPHNETLLSESEWVDVRQAGRMDG